MGLEISVRESADVTILDLSGRSTIDSGGSELLDEHLRKLIASGARKILLNLADLRQMDSSGVGTMVASYVSLRRQGGELKLLGPRGRVREVLELFRLLGIIPSFEDETEALASFQPEGLAATS